ncbi:MAG: tail fiber domain-containing protein [Flavobacterium sp.]|nr:tail fiber domain-containing protein [Flavobacterium sp.]
MKKLILFFVFVLVFFKGFSQVGINTTTPNAQLDIRSSNQATPSNTDGILIPKIDTFPIVSPGFDQHGMIVYLTTADLGKEPGFYYWNFFLLDWTPLSPKDYDFLESGTLNAPDDINDDIYHSGDVAIGKVTPSAKLDVESSFQNVIVRAANSFPQSGSYSVVYKSQISTVNQTNGSILGFENYVAPNLNNKAMGIFNDFEGYTTDYVYGVKNDFSTAGSGLRYGVSNQFLYNDGIAYGFNNVFSYNSSSLIAGLRNDFNGTTAERNGIANLFSGAGNGVIYGLKNTFDHTGNGNLYGTYTNVSNLETGTGTKYGNYVTMSPTAGGTHYGVYSEATKTNSFSGYFLGRFAIGSTTANTYIMPTSRGTNGQIMQTDGVGNVTWQNPNTALNNFAWTTTGNSGTNPTTHFMGTTDNQDVVFKRNGLLSGVLSVTNTIFGYNSFNTTTTGLNNVGLGKFVLQDNTTGYSNIAIGDSSLNSNTTGYENISIGYTNLLVNTTGASNTAVGSRAMVNNSSGWINTAVGNGSLHDNTTGMGNVAVGSVSLYNNTVGSYNVAMGLRSLFSNISGSGNTSLGTDALQTSTTGNNNTGLGYEALMDTNGSNNVSIGYQTLRTNTTGNGNVAIGNQAGYNELGSNKLYIENTASSTPLIYGEFDTDVLRSNSQRFFVNDPTVNGIQMLIKNSDRYAHGVDANLDFGAGNGYFMMATAESQGESGGIRGDGDNVSIWSPGDGGRQLRILDEDAWNDNNGNPYDNAAEVAFIANNGQYFQVSDRNKKENIIKIQNATTKINQISGYTYQFKLKPAEIEKGEKPTVSSGVLAQEIEQVLPEAIQKNEYDEYFVNYAAITPLLIEAIKEQNTKIQSLEQRLQQLEEKLSK